MGDRPTPRPEDRIVWLRAAEPLHFQTTALAVPGLHVPGDRQQFLDQLLLGPLSLSESGHTVG